MSDMSHKELLKNISTLNSLAIKMVCLQGASSALLVLGGFWWLSKLIQRIVNNKCDELVYEIRYWNLYISPFAIFVGIVGLIKTINAIINMKANKVPEDTHRKLGDPQH